MRYFAYLLLALTPFYVSAAEIQPVPANATKRVATVQIRVAPDHPDWTYKVGDAARFRVTVVADNSDIPDLAVKVAVGPEMMPAREESLKVPVGGVIIEGGTMKEPGFLRCTVTADVAGRPYKGVATAAFSPEKIQPTQTVPEDFDAFWDSVRADLAKTPLEAKLTLLPESCTAAVNVYHVALRLPGGSWQTNNRFYGILCEPTKPGKYPALLRVPGAGVRPYKGDVGMAEKGAITFEVGVHGIPVNMPQDVYDALSAGALNGYWTNNIDNRDTFYYRRVIQGCLRSNDFLTSRPMWDGKTLVVAGASQGGMLTVITTALDSRVTGMAVTHPAFCDVSGPLHGRAGGWPHPFRANPETGAPSINATPQKIETVRYYDVVNFARRVKVPGFFIFGYNDDVCPPTSVYAAYNVVTAPKDLALTLEMAHTYTAEQGEATSAWIAKAMGLK